MTDCFVHFKKVHPANKLVKMFKTDLSHIFPHLPGKKKQETDNMFSPAFEVFTEFRILSGNAYRAGVEVAFTHHYTAHGH